MSQTVLPRRSSRNARVGSWSSADLDDTSTKASVNSGGENPQDDEEALKWAALENLPTYNRLRTSILTSVDGDKVVTKEVDVRNLRVEERRILIEKLVPVPEEDNEKFLRRIRDRIDKVGVELPTIEVRFENFNIDAKCYVGGRALPTLWNVTRNIFEDVLEFFHLSPTKKASLNILNEVSGIIKPSRMTLLLGPPGSGKTSLLLALAGKLDPSLKTRGSITYNGYALHEFVPRKTSSYISQYDLHLGELTVRETLDFSAECQGVGTRYDMLLELAKREKVAGIIPDTEIDAFMKATAFKGVQGSLQADYIMKILGLDACADILVGDPMRRGISGGQKKRVTTGEMLVGPTRTYFMDDISTGLDSSTTFQIVKCLQEFVHVMEGTILMSLLQPPPETFELFDDIILLSEGLIVYQGPREHVLEFFETCGFRCPERKSIADFLQEVTSRKDQEQYWFDEGKAFRYVPVNEFANRFRNFHAGRKVADELAKPFPKEKTHKAALAFSKYSVSMMTLLKTCYARERLLMKRNSFVYIFKDVLLIILAVIGMTVFLRTRLKVETEDGADYLGALFFGLLVIMFNGFAEIAMTIIRLPVFYKQRDLLFYPAFAYAIPMVILKIPQSIIESGIWVTVTYFVIGFAPEPGRFFRMYLVLFLMHQMSASLFRLIGSLFRSMIISNVGGFSTLLIIFVLGGFVIPREKIPKWWIWAYWISPLAYGETAITINEFGASRWDKPSDTNPQITTGNSILQSRGLYTEPYFYWIGVGALLGFTVLFNILFTIALSYLNPLGKAKAVISKEALARTQANQDEAMDALPEPTGSGSGNASLARSTSAAEGNETFEVQMHSVHLESHSQAIEQAISVTEAKQGLSLPFQPFSISFKDVNYYVNMPAEMKQQGATEERLQLLRGVTGCVMPGILTALMGVSGAGKTTLMDVLAGRKTSGYIEGDIRISGFPKVQETFARISGYCEQTDIHSPQLTVHESLVFSAWLRLSADIDTLTKKRFVDEVMELVELDILRDALVGVPGISGLSTEQRKRLTIAVELVANPSIIFMDEPTSGLDARAAAIVMRTVRNTVDTGRTVVCTIHQPSIDICEAFDELLLMKPGGQLIYAGPLGIRSRDMIEYFEAIPGVPKIKGNYNPATWMLEVTSDAAEQRLGVDFADIYRKSSLFQRSEKMVDKLSSPSPDATDLYFPTQYCQSIWGQFVACLWKQNWTFWRSPGYNLVRFTFTFISALMLSTIFWRIGQNIEAEQDIFIIMGAMYGATLFLGINNGSTVQPVVSVERTVFYRERAAGLYSAFPYAISQVVIEFPYILVQTIMYGFITYAMIGFKWVAGKVMWYLFSMFSTFLYFTYYGLMAVSITPNEQAAAIVATSFYGLFNLFCGFIIPRPKIPGWWVWFYWICPTAWTVYGLVTSQFGDNDKIIRINGPPGSSRIDEFLADYFGFHYDFLGVVAAVLVIIPVLFACLFGFFLTKLNFQRR